VTSLKSWQLQRTVDSIVSKILVPMISGFSSSACPYRRWPHKLCTGDWFVHSLDRIKIIIFSAQQSVCAFTSEHHNPQTQMTGMVSSTKRFSPRLWCCRPWHLPRESNRRKPFPDAEENHSILPDDYDIAVPLKSRVVRRVRYSTTAEKITGLLAPGSAVYYRD